MDLHEIRTQLKLKNIYELPLKVTFYTRVSLDKEEQLNSLNNQIQYYTNLIKNNKNWTYIDGYIDEGISGITTRKREQFNQMIADGKEKKFDLIITKEISRFARNTLDSLQYTRELLKHGVGVFFQSDNICTFAEDSELRLTIMASLTQEESRKTSNRVKFGHQQAIKNGVVLGNSRIFGYKKENKRLIIDEKEAKMIRELYSLYATDKYSLKQLENIFWDKGYKNHRGNKIAHTTMSNIIRNPKYKGYYVGNKVRIVDMFTKKQKFLPEEEWVMYKDETGEIVPAIVSEELWDKANEVLATRSLDVKQKQGKCNHANIFTGKIYCAHCNKPYYRKDSKDTKGNKTSRWVCSGKIKNGSNSCPSFVLYEEELVSILVELFSSISGNFDDVIEKYIAIYKQVISESNYKDEIDALDKRIQTIEIKKRKLLDYNINGKISDDDFINMNNSCNEELNDLVSERDCIERQAIMSEDDLKKKVKELRELFKQYADDIKFGAINKSFVDRYIDVINVTNEVNKNGEKIAKLEVVLFNGERRNVEMRIGNRRSKNLNGRMGNTLNIIIPTRLMKFARNSRIDDRHMNIVVYKYSLLL